MKIKAQMTMVLNLDKCIGCHTCSIPCKHVWTGRRGVEYMWFNDVETKPGIGYPQRWENQDIYNGGWTAKDGKLRLRAGGRVKKFAKIFHNPDLPTIENYYDPWTYDYERLIPDPESARQPAARAKSIITGANINVKWGPNWEDDLAGVNQTGREDVNFNGMEFSSYLQFKDVFMFYLPRLCEHCLNPGCVASCPSGALHKRDEDGIVLVDQERCRGWRYCVSGCPYKKVYFNWDGGRAEKCLFCYPRIEAGLPTLCAESCVGRIRYIGIMLYDADRIRDAASEASDRQVYTRHMDIFLNPHDRNIASMAVEQGVPESFVTAAQHSPVYKLISEWKLALPPHPEFRTLPMVWYIPPLSPIAHFSDSPESMLDNIDGMRIPIKYLANLLAAGDEAPVRLALKRLLALRAYKRSVRVENSPDIEALESAGMNRSMAEDMYNLLAIGKHGDRFVVPTVRRESTEDLFKGVGRAGFPE
jgi:nitrate reductase / nitrite oxidoreductase, beta subunit